MKIMNLTLDKFRGIKSLSVDFGGKDTDIYGANGLGKTTIANAICWLLIDRPATEEPNFDPKTTGVHGVHHVASIKIEAGDGQEITFSKDFYEKFTRKKGSATSEYTGNVVDYFIDGVKSKQKEYNAAIERVCGLPLDKLKTLLVLSYFTDTMKTEEKRKILFELAGEFTDADILAANKDLQGLSEFLKMPGASGKFYTIDQWKKIAAEERKKLQKDLELLPTRIDEVQKSIPETLPDENGLRSELAQLEAQKDALEEEKRSLSTKDGQKDALRAAIAGLNTELESKRAEHIRIGAEANAETNANIDRLTKELRELDDGIYRDDKLLEQTRDRIADMEAKRQALMNEYAATLQESWDAGQEICPTCGQNLPPEKVQELRAEFNQKKSDMLASINRRGQTECSQTMIDTAKKEEAAIAETLEQTRTMRINVYQRLQNLKTAVITQPPFETTEEYSELARRIDELRAKAARGENAASEAETAILSKINDTKNAIANVTMEIAKAKHAVESQKRMDKLSEELKTTAENMERLEYGIHLCEEFTRTKAKLVTESINKHFGRVRFILFRDQINGGLKEVCEPTGMNRDGEWVEYRSLNYAEKINSQLDIVNTLNRHYGTNLPVIMDQGESVTAPMEIEEQFIRLIVSAPDTEEFRIRTREKGAA